MSFDRNKIYPFLVGIGILFPLFFTLGDGIYRNKVILSDSGGVIAALPLPLSIIICVVALIFQVRRLIEAKTAVIMTAGTVLLLLISLWLGGDGATSSYRKFIMIVQVGLPLMGLLVGQSIGSDSKNVAWGYLIVLSIIVPLQLYFPLLESESPWNGPTWTYSSLLADNIAGLFTIYGHIQYVTLIFVCAYAYTMASLWQSNKLWLIVLSVLIFTYVLRSFSYLTMAAYVLLVFVFISWRLLKLGNGLYFAAFLFAAVAVPVGGIKLYTFDAVQQDNFLHKSLNTAYGKLQPILEGKIPSNIRERFGDWELFGKRIIESPKTILVGHPEPMPREIRTSPHNWYIDIAHTFGLIGLLPILALLGYTFKLCWNSRRFISSETWWLVGIVSYLVFVDSNFKVTLRQPYPGIFTFFMWGMLLTQLETFKSNKLGRA